MPVELRGSFSQENAAALFPEWERESQLIHLAGQIEASSAGKLPDVARFTGTRLEADRALVQAIIERHLMGMSRAGLSRAFGLSRNSVAGILARAEASGRIEHGKKRLATSLGIAVEEGVEYWIDCLRDGRIKPDRVSVDIGIFSDKRALLEGGATSRVEHVQGTSREEIEAWLIDSIPVASDSASGAGCTISQQIGGLPLSVAGIAPSPGTTGTQKAEATGDQAEPAASAASAAEGDGGRGGGSAPGGGAVVSDGSDRAEFSAKEDQ